MTQSYLATDIGRVRSHNEDSLLALPEEQLYLVADGMGGQAAGELASRMLAESVRTSLTGREKLDETLLEHALQSANERILQEAASHPEHEGMGTTATLLAVQGREAVWAHVGDSRLYVSRGGELSQVTTDHSYVESLVAKGELTEEEARVHPKKNMLLRAVGVDRELRVDTGRFSLLTGDVLLLATDGLMKMVSDEEIESLLDSPAPQGAGHVAQRLVEAALAAGGTDNVTVIVVVYADEKD